MCKTRAIHRRSGEAGFTFMEVLAVVLLLGILALVALPNYFGTQADAQNAVRASNVSAINTALALYQYRNGGCPPTGPDGSIGAFLTDKAYFPDGSPVDPFTKDSSTFISNYVPANCRTK
jgi:prepilin-type N-terminal cleavage/methylation domain-containing protein